MALSKGQVAQLQRDLNHFTSTLGVGRLIVDGNRGHATDRRIHEAMFWLGYGPKKRAAGKVTHDFLWQLHHPRKARKPTKFFRRRTRRGIKRRIAHRRRVARNHVQAVRTSGVTHFDGRPVAKWIEPYLTWARRNGWQGTLTSGWRDPIYSEQLCIRICGRTSCPGKCAGRASNHSGSAPPNGAVDVSDYVRFGQLMAHCPLNPKLVNHLPVDRVHYSVSGR